MTATDKSSAADVGRVLLDPAHRSELDPLNLPCWPLRKDPLYNGGLCPPVDVVILSAARTPIGRYGGSFSEVHPAELGAVAARAAIERAGLTPPTSTKCDRPWPAGGSGPNPGVRSGHRAGVPHTRPRRRSTKRAPRASRRSIRRAVDHARRNEDRARRRHRVDEPDAVSDRCGGCAVGSSDGEFLARRRDVSRRLPVPAVESRSWARPRRCWRQDTASPARHPTASRSKASARRGLRSTAGQFAREIAPVTCARARGAVIVEIATSTRARDDAREPPQAAAGFPTSKVSRYRHSRDLVGDHGRRRRAGAGVGEAARRSRAETAARISGGRARASIRGSWASGRCRRCRSCASGPASTLDDFDLVELNEAFAPQVLAVLAGRADRPRNG